MSLPPLPEPPKQLEWTHYTAEDLRAAQREMAEECAKLCEPKSPRPCDCERCDCGNSTDARMVAEWDEAAARAAAIRAKFCK